VCVGAWVRAWVLARDCGLHLRPVNSQAHQGADCSTSRNSARHLVKTFEDDLGKLCTVQKALEQAGLAGFVARTGVSLNELDVTRVCTDDNTRYDPAHDFITGMQRSPFSPSSPGPPCRSLFPFLALSLSCCPLCGHIYSHPSLNEKSEQEMSWKPWHVHPKAPPRAEALMAIIQRR
jgi:hypothetical protein